MKFSLNPIGFACNNLIGLTRFARFAQQRRTAQWAALRCRRRQFLAACGRGRVLLTLRVAALGAEQRDERNDIGRDDAARAAQRLLLARAAGIGAKQRAAIRWHGPCHRGGGTREDLAAAQLLLLLAAFAGCGNDAFAALIQTHRSGHGTHQGRTPLHGQRRADVLLRLGSCCCCRCRSRLLLGQLAALRGAVDVAVQRLLLVGGAYGLSQHNIQIDTILVRLGAVDAKVLQLD